MGGYAPIGAYLDEEGYRVGVELREGRAHSANEADHVLERVLNREGRLSAAPIPVRMDSGFDAGKCFTAIAAAPRARQRAGGAATDALVKWTHRDGGAADVLVLSLAALAYNVLRLIGQNALTGEDAPPRHPAKRRRLSTVIQELMCVAAAIAHHARSRALVFSAHCPALACFQRLHAQWGETVP